MIATMFWVVFIKVGRTVESVDHKQIWEKCNKLSPRRKCMMLNKSKFVQKEWAKSANFNHWV